MHLPERQQLHPEIGRDVGRVDGRRNLNHHGAQPGALPVLPFKPQWLYGQDTALPQPLHPASARPRQGQRTLLSALPLWVAKAPFCSSAKHSRVRKAVELNSRL